MVSFILFLCFYFLHLFSYRLSNRPIFLLSSFIYHPLILYHYQSLVYFKLLVFFIFRFFEPCYHITDLLLLRES